MRPIIIFNRVGTTVDGVARREAGGWQGVPFLLADAQRCELE